jgi:hypothetical protein
MRHEKARQVCALQGLPEPGQVQGDGQVHDERQEMIADYDELKAAIADEIDYDPVTGVFRWKRDGRGCFKRAGAEAGWFRPDGYKGVGVLGRQWLCHRLAWVMVYGEEPPKIIDHIDRNKANNAISNLRDGTDGVNEINMKAHKDSRLGICGVRHASKAGHYQAYINRKSGFVSLYHGPDFFEACCARKTWEAKFWEAVA